MSRHAPYWMASFLTCVAVVGLNATPVCADAAPADRSDVFRCGAIGRESAAGAQQVVQSDIPAARREILMRGVNVTDLFDPDNQPDVTATFQQVRAAGFRHVRIPVDPRTFADNPPAWRDKVVQRLDQSVCAAINEDLGVIIDLHPFAALGPADEPIDAMTQRLATIWHRIATRYASAPTDRVFFELFNEPKLVDENKWRTIQATFLRAVRSAAPGNTVIATGSPWSTIAAVGGLNPLPDRNVAYAFHFYTPMIFTHQGTTWSQPSYASIAGLTFPATPENVEQVAQGATHDRQAELSIYEKIFRDGTLIGADITFAADWARRHGTFLVVTEFGVYAKAPQPARAAWLAAVRRDLEAYGIGWTVWEYRGGFGIESEQNRPCHVIPAAAEALGLCKA